MVSMTIYSPMGITMKTYLLCLLLYPACGGSSKQLQPTTKPHGVTSQKTVFFKDTTLRTTNLTTKTEHKQKPIR